MRNIRAKPKASAMIAEASGAIAIDAVKDRLVTVRGELSLLDCDVAAFYGVETKRVNEAVRNNPDKFPSDYMFKLSKREVEDLRSKISTTNLQSAKGRPESLRSKISSLEGADLRSKFLIAKISPKSRYLPKAFTEKGLYMLATILKSRQATAATFAIIETFAKVRGLKRELVELHAEKDRRKKASLVKHFGEALTDIVMPDFDATETESSLEINFFIGKLKHTVRRIRRAE